MSLLALASTCVGKDTNFSASSCAQELSVFDTATQVKATNGSGFDAHAGARCARQGAHNSSAAAAAKALLAKTSTDDVANRSPS